DDVPFADADRSCLISLRKKDSFALQRLRQHLLILAARHIDRTEALQMLGGELRIEQRKAARLQALDEMDEAGLRCIRLLGKHAFAEEHPSQRHAVEAADQLVLAPGFDRMAVAHAVQLHISLA